MSFYAVRAFQRCLLPIIIIDAAHLKGKYLGTMFPTIGMDGNNQLLHIVFFVGKSGESWIWFLSRLKKCIGDISSLANSIEMTIQVVFSNAYHRLCCRYLLMNMRANIGYHERTKILFWEAAKAY
uniref:MULE transposase domain-containing protein n=1 Tax=Lactuca sativa TaxID=4236 RepID=A0A9R1UHX2_LACSA|nr:hypothetical protein LSAT_V11C900482560 [Lactuca sativa]